MSHTSLACNRSPQRGRLAVALKRTSMVLVMVCAGSCAPATWGASGGPCDEDTRMRALVEQAVREDGYAGSVTIYRGDRRTFPIIYPVTKPLVYYEVEEGGLERDSAGELEYKFLSHPRLWRLFVDQTTMEVFRLFGFRSGSDYGRIAQARGLQLSMARAKLVAEGYAEYCYSADASVMRSLVDALAFAEGRAAEAGVDADRACYESWRRKWIKCLVKEIAAPTATTVDGGYRVALVVGTAPANDDVNADVELRSLVILVGEDGSVRVSDDARLAVGPSLSTVCGEND